MAKKIRFPLKLADGTQARSLEELKEHFDLASVLEHYSSGKLLTWLQDRYIESEAQAVAALDREKPDFQKNLCAIFDVEYVSEEDLEAIQLRQERLAKLRMITDEDEYLQNIDRVAFDQEELADLLDEGITTIYLCGNRFLVPISQKGVTYIGINSPAVHLSGTFSEDTSELGITCKNCAVDNWTIKSGNEVLIQHPDYAEKSLHTSDKDSDSTLFAPFICPGISKTQYKFRKRILDRLGLTENASTEEFIRRFDEGYPHMFES